MCDVGIFHGESLLRYSFPDHPYSRKRVERFWELVRKEPFFPQVTILRPTKAREETVRRFHTGSYVKFVKNAEKQGVRFLDTGDTPTFPGVFDAASTVVGSTLAGLRLVMESDVRHVFTPVGGLHHAFPDRASGFCVFNDAALAIIVALEDYGLNRIAYVDIDAHHGDGVFYAFERETRVIIADTHEDGRFLFPGTGLANEIGKGAAKGTKMNVPLDPGADDQDFFEALKNIEAFVEAAKPELIIFQAGADGLAGDPLTHLTYSPEVHRRTGRVLHRIAHAHADGRILAMGGGGYDVENVAKAWLEIVKAFVG